MTIGIAGGFFFVRGQAIMEEQIKDKLRSTAAAAAMQFDAHDLAAIRTGDTLRTSAALRRVVARLQTIRETIGGIRYAYIMRRTSNPHRLEFVADADLALTEAQLDRNQNGVIESDEEASQPGDPYDWTEFPALETEAFLHPAVDAEIGQDQWGPTISGYAPISLKGGPVMGILGLDMDASEFTALSQSIFSPIAMLLIVLAMISIGGGVVLFLWRRRLEAIEHLDIERSGLLRLAFHQLGGPLTIISWALEEMEDDGPQSLQRAISNIHEGLRRLNQILRTLKDADLIHAGRLEYKPEFVSLSAILREVVKEAGTRLAIRKQQVTLDCSDNVTMALDPKLIAGVAQELLTNAMDFSPDGGSIVIRSRRVGSFAEFDIEDLGCGIPKKDLPHLFDEFTRGSNAITYKADGNGLGLYIVRGIVERAGGTVTISSAEGKGTTATVRLPIA